MIPLDAAGDPLDPPASRLMKPPGCISHHCTRHRCHRRSTRRTDAACGKCNTLQILQLIIILKEFNLKFVKYSMRWK